MSESLNDLPGLPLPPVPSEWRPEFLLLMQRLAPILAHLEDGCADAMIHIGVVHGIPSTLRVDRKFSLQ